jgi:hypothetical protein
MADDFANGTTANYVYVTPDGDDDSHDGTLAQADRWLQANLPSILARPEFGAGGDGILFIAWDEGNLSTDDRCSATVNTGCGGRVATLVIGPQVNAGYQSTITYHSENLLATVCAAMGLATCPGAAHTAAPMADFFKNGSTNGSDGVVISTPGNGATVTGAVHLIASATESQNISELQVWDNGVKLGRYAGDAVDATYKLAPGIHTTSVIDLDASYKMLHKSSVTYSVEALVYGVQVISPSPAETFNMTTVHVVAQANESVAVNQIQVWDNGKKLGWYSGANVNQYFSLAPGSHTLTVTDLDSNSNILHRSSVSYSVQ